MAEPYRVLRFDEGQIPKGLLRDHSLKAGVRGELAVRRGGLTYVDARGHATRLEAGAVQAIPPEEVHHLTNADHAAIEVRFFHADAPVASPPLMPEPEIVYRPAVVADPTRLFEIVRDQTPWTEQMVSRKTASMGRPYNYKGASYPVTPWVPAVASLRDALVETVGFEATNCLLNYYPTGRHSLGWHQDDVSILQPGTGIAIVSLGVARPLRLRRPDPSAPNGFEYRSVLLEPGSVLLMSAARQRVWQNALRRADTTEPRISLTFRRIVRWREDGSIA
jgi:alkylated DNA repair dioxygenase AlkB/tellurite resistance-related uncharacterized protein